MTVQAMDPIVADHGTHRVIAINRCAGLVKVVSALNNKRIAIHVCEAGLATAHEAYCIVQAERQAALLGARGAK